MTYSSDFVGLAGLSITTIGTLALAKEVTKSMRDISRPTKRHSSKRR